MKIKSIPQTYEAIRFINDIEVCKEIEDFVKDTWAQFICDPDKKILSTVVGNQILNDGDIIYKDNNMCFLFKTSVDCKIFDKYFEVIDET